MLRLPRHTLIVLQLVLLAGVFAVAVLTPPARGPMLLLSWSGRLDRAVDLALAHGARLAGRGPVPGSVVVVGERAALAPAARSAGMILLAAPFAGCGSTSADAA